MRVSLCMPIREEPNPRTVQSIRSQTLKPDEILFERAKGIGKARKLLVERASGDLIAWLDSDVVVPPNWLEINAKIHVERQDVLILSGVGSHSLKESCESLPVKEWFGSSQAACSMKKRVFSTITYDEHFRRGEDFDLVVNAHYHGIKTHLCSGLSYFHINRSRTAFLKDMVSSGAYVLFLRKYGSWYIRCNPRHFLAFTLRIMLIYIPVIYPFAWVIYNKSLEKLAFEFVKGVGEHLYLLRGFLHRW